MSNRRYNIEPETFTSIYMSEINKFYPKNMIKTNRTPRTWQDKYYDDDYHDTYRYPKNPKY